MTPIAKRRQVVQEQLTELHQQKDANDLEISRIKKQLEDARYEAASSGVYADPKWYARAQFALRAKGREAQRLQVKIGETGRLLRKLNNAQIDQCFVAAARKLLERDVFSEVWAYAENLSSERAGGEDDIAEASDAGANTPRMVQVTRARSPDARRD